MCQLKTLAPLGRREEALARAEKECEVCVRAGCTGVFKSACVCVHVWLWVLEE